LRNGFPSWYFEKDFIATRVLQKIRTAQVAKHLGVSSRQLRELVSEVNFGIKPTDREIPFAIASGIIRFAAKKLGIEYVPLEISAITDEDLPEEEISVSPVPQKIAEDEAPKRASFSTLEQLRHIGAQGKEDMERHQQKKKDEEEEKKKAEAQKEHGPKVLRKIEISPAATADAQKKRVEKEAERKRKKEQEEETLLERKLQRKKRQDEIFKKKEGVVEIPSELTVKEFSEKIGVPVPQVISTLLKNGMPANINQLIDFDTCAIIAEDLEVNLKREESSLSSEDIARGDISKLLVDDPEHLKTRPPVIVVMGHVDHGKTSILDSIRKTKVVSGESGGITQHIGAYQVTKKGKAITFLDTPGHEAFTSMRARGAKTADIAILVVAADDGIKPQTVEAINHAKIANLPIIVAANKIDKEHANLDKLRGELSEHGLRTEDWGGDVPFIPVSALSGQGIDDLLEIVLLQAEILELKANPNRLAVGTVIESHLDPSLGPVATILVNTGTMNIRDIFVLGSTFGRVKTIVNDEGKNLKKVLPSGAARISGIDEIPYPGDIFQVVPSEKILKQKREELEALSLLDKKPGMGMADLVKNIKSGTMKHLNLVVKTDTIGSLEAIEQAIANLGNDEVRARVIHSAVGGISENDVMMAAASHGMVISFHVKTPPTVRQIAEREGVEIRHHEIIYNLTEEIFGILEGMLEPEVVETVTGILDVKGVFYSKGKMRIVGGKVRNGYFIAPQRVRILNGEELVQEVRLSSIQHFEEKVKEIKAPQECGLQLEGITGEIKEGYRIEGFTQETILRKLAENTRQK